MIESTDDPYGYLRIFNRRELNGELVHDWSWGAPQPHNMNSDAAVVTPLQPDTHLGGPFAHKVQSGVCTVCGYQERWGLTGCPVRVDMHTYRSGTCSIRTKAYRAAMKAAALLRAERMRELEAAP